ncbi:MAG TPA: hypothetical protein VFQ36_23005 [Ktedonobacteraceae bacterium]|nr:hypothetical protein [Ktedonobacteraceae bacterium]
MATAARGTWRPSREGHGDRKEGWQGDRKEGWQGDRKGRLYYDDDRQRGRS